VRRAAKVDDNQERIANAIRKNGGSVYSGAALGKGVPDLVVGVAGRTGLFEVKDGSKPPSARKLTPDQEKFRREWKGHYCVVSTVEEALTQLDFLRML